MPTSASTLVALHLLSHKGHKALGSKWASFRSSLHASLQQQGLEDEASSGDLLLFQFSHPLNGLAALFEALDRAKKGGGWGDQGPVPIQIVVHLRSGSEPFPLKNPRSTSWDMLRQEAVYLTRPLKAQWQNLTADQEVPAVHFEGAGRGLFLARFEEQAGTAWRRQSLFPYRGLPLQGGEKECFYCGATNHLPAACPSKALSMDTQGLDLVGYLPFPELAKTYQAVFEKYDSSAQALRDGITREVIRLNPALQVFVAHLDLYRIYQPRFLDHLAFSPYYRWEEVYKMDKREVDSRSLHLGLDCLRVGQYDKLGEYFEETKMRREGKLFYTKVALAFCALEQGRIKDMGTLLETAANLTSLEKERVYVNLLLTRYYALHDEDFWKAEQTIGSLTSTFPDAPEPHYCRTQVMVRENFGSQAYAELEALIERKSFFITALLDPALTSIQGLVENMLTARLHDLKQQAKESLREAEESCRELQAWFKDQKDERLQANLTVYANLEKQYERSTCFDLYDVLFHSKKLVVACSRLQHERIDDLYKRLDEISATRQHYLLFWKDYSFKALFGPFGVALGTIQGHLEQTDALLKKSEGEAFHKALLHFEKAEESLETLHSRFIKMIWAQEALQGVWSFGKRLMITECALGVLVAALSLGLSTLLSDNRGNLSEWLNDPWFHKQVFLFSSLLIAPFFALVLTFLDRRNAEE